MNNTLQQYLIPLSIIVAGALVAVGIYFGGHSAPSAPAEPELALTTENEPFIGNAKAPVTLYYWSDYQCPFCKQFETTSLQSVIADYANDKKVKIVFKDLQFLGDDSTDSALIARAVWEQYPDKYFAWREGYFAKQDEEQDIGFGDKDSVLAYTKTVEGMDTAKIEELVNQNLDKYHMEIENDRTEGAENGVSATPGVIVGNKAVSNPLSYPALKAAIEAQLNKKK